MCCSHPLYLKHHLCMWPAGSIKVVSWSKYRWSQRARRENTEKKSIWRHERRLALRPEEFMLTLWVPPLVKGLWSTVAFATYWLAHWACSEKSDCGCTVPLLSSPDWAFTLIHILISALIFTHAQQFCCLHNLLFIKACCWAMCLGAEAH